MSKSIVIGAAIITLVESKAVCPHCERLIPFAEIESKWMKGNGHIKIKCKCNRFVGITSDIQGDFKAYELKNKQQC